MLINLTGGGGGGELLVLLGSSCPIGVNCDENAE